MTSLDRFALHLRLIRHLLRAEIEPVCATLSHWDENDWQSFVAFLLSHRLRECYWSALEAHTELQEHTPTAICQRLSRYAAYSGRRVAALGRLEERAGAVLTGHGIDWLTLKGATLAERFYPSDQPRHQGDVDLLVREKDLSTAVDVLQSVGLQLRGNRQAVRPAQLQVEHAAALSDGTHAIDLHWKLRSGPGYRISMDSVFESAQTCSSGGRKVRTLADEYLVILLCLSLVHDLGRGGLRLKLLVDLFHVRRQLKQLVASSALREQSRRCGVSSLCREALALAEAVFPVERTGTSISELPQPALELLAAPRGGVANWLWFSRRQRLWEPRRMQWFVRKQVPYAGRIPVALIRLFRAAPQLASCLLSNRSRAVYRFDARKLMRHGRQVQARQQESAGVEQPGQGAVHRPAA